MSDNSLKSQAPGAGRRAAARPGGWTPAVVRILFGVIFSIDAMLKWLPGYRRTFLSDIGGAASGQPPWLRGWFQFWLGLISVTPLLFAVLIGLTETSLALVLLFGVARRAGYLGGAGYGLLLWTVPEGFGGPYTAGATDPGTGIMYALLFLTLLTFAPPARRERLSLDRVLVARWPRWRVVAEPHAADRARGAGAAIGEQRPAAGQPAAAPEPPAMSGSAADGPPPG